MNNKNAILSGSATLLCQLLLLSGLLACSTAFAQKMDRNLEGEERLIERSRETTVLLRLKSKELSLIHI